MYTCAQGAEWQIFSPRNSEVKSWLACTPVTQIAIEFHDRKPWLSSTEAKTARGNVTRLLGRCGFVKRHTSASKEEILYVRAHNPGPACPCSSCTLRVRAAT